MCDSFLDEEYPYFSKPSWTVRSSGTQTPKVHCTILTAYQSKEYVANNANDNGANIPLSLEFVDDKHLQFQYQASGSVGRVAQWQKTIVPNRRYKIGIAINTGSPGWVELYIDGKQQALGNGVAVKRLVANTFPGRADPKFGAYRGEDIDIDTFVYDVQVGESKVDVARAAGFSL